MSDELIVLTASTVGPNHPESGTLALYLSQLEAAGIDHYCEPLTEFPSNGGSLSYKVTNLRRRVVENLHYDKIVFTDGHDMQYFGRRDDLISKIPEAGVILGAERNCYPEPDIAHLIQTPRPFSFANGGWLAGTPESFLLWLDAIEQHARYSEGMLDQGWFNRRLADNDPLIMIDYHTALVYCTYGESGNIADLQWEDSIPINTLYGTHPNFIHCNGHWPSDHIYARRKK